MTVGENHPSVSDSIQTAAEQMFALNNEAWETGPRNFAKVTQLIDASLQLAGPIPTEARPPRMRLEWAVATSIRSSLVWDRCDYVSALNLSSAAVQEMESLVSEGLLGLEDQPRAREWLSKSYNTLGISHDLRGEHGHAAVAYQKALEAARGLNMPVHIAQVYSNLGCSFGAIGQYARALEVNLKANEIHRSRSSSSTSTVLSYCALSETCLALNQPQEAEAHARTALNIAEREGFEREAVNSLIKLAQVAAHREDWIQAESAFETASQRAAAIPHPSHQAAAANGLGEAYLASKQPAKAAEAFALAARLREDAGELVWEAEARIGLGRAFRRLGRGKEAADALIEALQLAVQKDRKQFAADAAAELSSMAEEQGDLPEALRYLRLYQQYREAVLNKETIRQTSGLRVVYETERIQREAAAERARKEELEQLLEIAESAKAKAEEATRIKSEFLSIAAHDLRGPLGAVSQLAEFVDETTSPDTRREYLSEIRHAVAQMLRLVKDVLDASILETHPMALEMDEVNLPLLVQFAAKQAQRLAAEKNQTIDLNITLPADTEMEGDISRLQQVFDNLFSNAVKFSPPATPINARLEAAAKNGRRYLRFSVQDAGPGFSEEQAKRLFQAFSRIGSHPTGGESSIGLGLLIVKRLVELHGGEVWAHSDGPGKGAIFGIDFPSK